MVSCPHCGTQRIVTSKVPKDVVVVMPCPACHELVVLFRNKVIALNREIIEGGTFEERTTHIAEIVAEFLESGIFPFLGGEGDAGDSESFIGKLEHSKGEGAQPRKGKPITQHEVDRFIKFELQRIDEVGYFKRHFG